jgi:hypothetical protein
MLCKISLDSSRGTAVSCEQILTFEKWFFKHQVVNIEPPSEARMIITKAYIATLLQRQQLLNLLLHAAGDVLVYVDQPQHARASERERKILNRPTDRKPCVRIFVIWLQVIHRGKH